MNHSIPARLLPSTVSAVSSAPHSLPFAYITCCMRVSFESGREITSLCAGSPTNSSRQHPRPAIVCVVVSLMQSPCAAFGVVTLSASVPEPGCCCFGGIPYCPTVRTLLVRFREGDAVFSDEVFFSVQTTRLVEEPVKSSPAASSPAFELRKYSVPPAFRSNELVPGECAGQTVKPGWVCTVGEVAFTIPVVSMCTIVTLAAPAASCAFEKA